jgi:glutaredoxin
MWAKFGPHPCWKVQKALDDAGVEYEVVKGSWPGRKDRTAVREGTGQTSYPAIEFEDGSWYREESAQMAETIRAGRLMEKQASAAS